MKGSAMALLAMFGITAAASPRAAVVIAGFLAVIFVAGLAAHIHTGLFEGVASVYGLGFFAGVLVLTTAVGVLGTPVVAQAAVVALAAIGIGAEVLPRAVATVRGVVSSR